MKLLDKALFDMIEEEAVASPRRRMNYDLRTQAFEEGWKDTSQRMLNVMMKDTVIPIHRHSSTSETCIVLSGSGDEVIYNEKGEELQRVTLRADGDCRAVQVPRNTYHTFIPREDGTVIFEAKDRAYDPMGTEELKDNILRTKSHGEEWKRAFYSNNPGRKIMDVIGMAKDASAPESVIDYIREELEIEKALA